MYAIDGHEGEYATLSAAIAAARRMHGTAGMFSAPAYWSQSITLLQYPDPAGSSIGRVLGETTQTIAVIRRLP